MGLLSLSSIIYGDLVMINNDTSQGCMVAMTYEERDQCEGVEKIEIKPRDMRTYETGDCCVKALRVVLPDDAQNMTVSHGTDDKDLIDLTQSSWSICRNWYVSIIRAGENRLKVSVDPIGR